MASGSFFREVRYRDIEAPPAYHGTSSKCAEAILASGQFVISRKPENLFGDGVYFYEEDPAHCAFFGENTCREDNSPYYVIISAKVEYGRCLNLALTEYREELRKLWDFLTGQDETLSQLGIPKQSINSYVLINYAAGLTNIDTVRIIKDGQKKKLFPDSPIKRRSGIILVVRNVSKIRAPKEFDRGECCDENYARP